VPQFGALIREKRLAKGLTLYQLGLEAGVQPATLSKIERTGNCMLSNALRLCSVLGIDAIPVKGCPAVRVLLRPPT